MQTNDPNLKGLTTGEVQKRMEQGTFNKPIKSMSKSIPQIFKDNIFTLFNVYNVIIAVVLIAVGAYKDATFLVIVFGNCFIGIAQEIRGKYLVDKLTVLSSPKVTVIRDSKKQTIDVHSVVLDDVLYLGLGNQVSCDAIVLQGSIEANEALLTGESDAIDKSCNDELMSGSFIVSGECYAKVIHVGEDNFAARITKEAQAYKKFDSGIMDYLNRIVRFTSYFIVPMGALLLLNYTFILHSDVYTSVVGTATALVGLLPKGLVLLTTLSLVVGVINLARKRVLVQELYGIETLSRVDTLCLDKTGTLTKGIMEVSDMKVFDETLPIQDILASYQAYLPDNNPTANALRAHFSGSHIQEAISSIPFSSDRKWSSVEFKEFGTIVIGAPDILYKEEGIVSKEVQAYMEEGYRVVLVAMSDHIVDYSLCGVKPLAVIALQDPIRDNAKEIVHFFQEQDVAINIISGDHPKTVQRIAQIAGLTNYTSIDATTLSTTEDYDAAILKYRVFGRVMPNQKKELIKALQRQQHIVAMTGDGVNDVLALKQADCSIAMADGSDAPKQVAKVLLLDNDFAVLPNVVKEGRRVINNVTRTASLFLVKTIFTFLLTFATILLGFGYPFNTASMTLVSLLIEGIPATILQLEPNNERVKGNFMRTVITNSIPSAILITVYAIIIVKLLGPALNLTTLETSTFAFYALAAVNLWQLFHVSRPINILRGILCVTMAFAFYGAAYFGRDFFSLGVLPSSAYISFATIILITYPLQLLLAKGLKLIQKNTAN